LAAKALPPRAFEPVGVAFIAGSISAPSLVEALKHTFPKDHPLRALFLVDRPGGEEPYPSVNLLLLDGVRSCLEFQKTGDVRRARAVSNRSLSPHLSLVDMAGHGYATVRVTRKTFETDFVCIPRPLEQSPRPDGGPLRYRVRHRARIWRQGETPKLEQQLLEGDPWLPEGIPRTSSRVEGER
jgi:alkaline phosphatase D